MVLIPDQIHRIRINQYVIFHMKRDRTQAVAGEFQKFEIVWARLDGRRWRLVKILLPDSHKAGNFMVASPTTQKMYFTCHLASPLKPLTSGSI